MSLFRPASAQIPVQTRVYCDRCQRWFVNDRALEQHTSASFRHNVCSGCDFDYITRDEMEDCDCDGSEDDDEDLSDEYGSAGTLSDDGGGAQDPSAYGFVLGDRFNTYYTVPGAWRGGTRTTPSPSGSSMPSYGPGEWNPAEGYDSEYYGTPSEASYSHSDDATEEDEDEEEDEEMLQRDAGQLPVQNAEASPYCQRCNRVFNTVNGMHMHNRMSNMHPWYCSSCRIDYDREDDLERHNSTVHANGAQPAARQQSTAGVADTRSRAVNTVLGHLSTQLRGMLDRSTPADADTSSSTIQPTTINAPVPPPLPSTQAEPIPMDGQVTGTGNTNGSSLVVTCPLCLGDTVALTSTLCGHVFCKECITAAIRHKPECPVCRAFTHIRSLHPIFLNIITS